MGLASSTAAGLARRKKTATPSTVRKSPRPMLAERKAGRSICGERVCMASCDPSLEWARRMRGPAMRHQLIFVWGAVLVTDRDDKFYEYRQSRRGSGNFRVISLFG